MSLLKHTQRLQLNSLLFQTSTRVPNPLRLTNPLLNRKMTSQSHAVGDSIVPETAQEKLPQGVEENVPNVVHDTGSTGSKSHATGDSIVPKVVQEAVPKKLEEVLPNKIHDTSPGGVATAPK